MPKISGRVQFDADRTATFLSTYAGIENVLITLTLGGNTTATTTTDADGNYAFTGISAGTYQATATRPSLDVDCTTRSTRPITVAGSNLTNQNFSFGPVKNTPMSEYFFENVDPTNLIQSADGGTFGSFPIMTAGNTGAGTSAPYLDINSDFTYVVPTTGACCPMDGEYTVQNLMNNSHSNTAGTWWRISDHTAGDETGRMMVVNGANPGAMIFQETVVVQPNTKYRFAIWVLNLCKKLGYAEPEFDVIIMDPNGNTLYNDHLGAHIPINTDSPEWKQVGTFFNSGETTTITVQLKSTGPAATGNDFAIDDITLNAVYCNVTGIERDTGWMKIYLNND